MTASTQGFTAQGLAGSGILPQQGTFTPGFPPSIGAEHYLGTAQQYGFPTPGWPQGPYGMQAPYGQVPWSPAQAQFGSQALPGFSQGPAGQVPQQQIQQAFLQLIGQILPIAQQMILPQVTALALQQVQQHVHQLVTQLALPQFTGQQPWMTAAAPGLAGQFTRPYPAFS
jgi:hypothetical protein